MRYTARSWWLASGALAASDDRQFLWEELIPSDAVRSGSPLRITSIVGRVTGYTYTPQSGQSGPLYATSMSAPTMQWDAANRSLKYAHASGFASVFGGVLPTSFSCRVYLPSLTNFTLAQIDNLGFGSPSVSRQTFYGRTDASGQLSYARLSSGASTANVSAAGSYTVTNAWRTLGWTWDGSRVYIYVDGVAFWDAANTRSIGGTALDRIVVCNAGGSVAPNGGHLGAWRLYNGARSARQHLSDHQLFSSIWY